MGLIVDWVSVRVSQYVREQNNKLLTAMVTTTSWEAVAATTTATTTIHFINSNYKYKTEKDSIMKHWQIVDIKVTGKCSNSLWK